MKWVLGCATPTLKGCYEAFNIHLTNLTIPTLTFVFLFMTIKIPGGESKMPKLGVVSGRHPSVPPALCRG